MGFFDANCLLLADQSLASRFESSSVLKRRFDSDDRHPELETAMKIFKGPDGMPRRADESSVVISGPSSLPDTPRGCRICDISKKSRRCRFEMLIKTRILHVQTARSLRQAANKPKAAPKSQAYFKVDVPKWSDYFSTDVPAPPMHSSDPVPDLDDQRPKHRCVDTSEKRSRRERFEMLIQKRALRVEAIRRSRRAADKNVTASASQAYFHIIVPKWSDYFVDSPCEVFGTWPLPEKKICSIQSELHQVQKPDRSHSSDTSQQSDEDRSEKMEPVPLSVCVDRVSDLEDPSAKRCHLDALKENGTKKMQKKILIWRLAPTYISFTYLMRRKSLLSVVLNYLCEICEVLGIWLCRSSLPLTPERPSRVSTSPFIKEHSEFEAQELVSVAVQHARGDVYI
ncbi:Thyrotropin-releasing hormone-degrading ectoenzyme [Triplophysa tibetana]|uniref:Thyrotropin-releasing hormone-degrading ectoenzyme n=1 Tax=Triplophysa tibetana TaxID=1572043 RepID=A0A5A9PHN0_9TELE|nr:Thyrotropin-releasing hormone-degrading ectoenzyme [Triplophysa tibetana]